MLGVVIPWGFKAMAKETEEQQNPLNGQPISEFLESGQRAAIHTSASNRTTEVLNDNDASENFQKPRDATKGEAAKQVEKQGKQQKMPNVVDGRYEIHTDKPISVLSSEFAKAYEISDKKFLGNTSLYCLVFNKSVQPRIQAINAFKSMGSQNFIMPVTSGITFISSLNEYHFTVVLPKPPGKTLVDLIAEHGALSEDFITNNVVAGLIGIMSALENESVTHGRINLSNIFINEKKQVILGECISEPTGYSQPYFFETIERSKVLPIGKGDGDSSIDYYALGMVILCLQKGKNLPDKIEDDTLLAEKLMNGTFNTLIQNIVLNASMMDLYRGLLNDKPSSRWQSAQIKDWLKGKQFNLVRIPPTVEATRSIYFNDVQYFNRQSLCHALFKNWGISRTFLREDKVVKWIEGSVGLPGLAEQLRQIQKVTSTGNMKNAIFDANDELVTRSLLVLDTTGPLRIKTLSVNFDALGNFLAYEFSKKNMAYIHILNTFLRKNTYMGKDTDTEEKKQSSLVRRLSDLITISGIGFGMERCLYELNSALPCQSPIVMTDYILTLNQLLEVLDAKVVESDKYPLDAHIAAFIAHRIGLGNEIHMKSLTRFRKFQENQHVQAIALFNLAQKESGIKKLRGLTMIMGKYLLSTSELIYSKSLKAEFNDNIRKLSKDGSFASLYHYVTDPQLLIKDEGGFREAQHRYHNYSTQLKKLNRRNSIANLGYHYGLRLAVVVAYILCSIVFFILLGK